MTRRPRTPPPLWFLIALTALVSTIAHLCGGHDRAPAGVDQAFIGWLVQLGIIIWAGIQTTVDAVVAFLSWAVNALFWLVQTTYNALIDVAKVAMKGLTKTWQFFRDTFDHVLKPAWLKFWKLIDSVKDTLERVLKPVFKILRRFRDEFLRIYTKWVRPVLDTISVTRKMLSVLSALHVKFAKKLDAKLAALEDAIDRPFRLLLTKVNQVINAVDRIATAGGLFQRLALVRSIERDILFIHREFLNAWQHPLTDADQQSLRDANAPKPLAAIVRDTRDYLEAGDGPDAAIVNELVAQARIDLRAA